MGGLTRDETIALLKCQISDLYNIVHERNNYHGIGVSTETISKMLDRAIVFNKAVEAFDIGGDLNGAN